MPHHEPYKISLLGDSCLDIYWFGKVPRLSPEAPVPVFCVDRKESRPGMAGNVKNNLENLGAQVEFYHNHAGSKIRLIDLKSAQHIARVDQDCVADPVVFHPQMVHGKDALVISDYGKGAVTYELIETVRDRFAGPIFVDTKKKDLRRLEGCVVKINSHEADQLLTTCTDLVITRGAQGVTYQGQTWRGPQVDVTDVCGAGDTFLAALAMGYLENGDITTALQFALRASAVTVQHLGAYAPTRQEIDAAVW